MYGSGVGAAIGNIAGGAAILAGAGETNWSKRYQMAVDAAKALQSPDFDMRDITPQQLALVAEFFPEEYSAIIQSRPELVQGSPEMRAAQSQALAHLAGYTQEGLPLSERLAMEDIRRQTGLQERGMRQAALESMASQGRLGGGQEALLRAVGNQGAMETMGGLGRGMAQEALQARLQATLAGGQMAGQVRGQDVLEQMANADAINRFNEWVSQLQTAVAGENARARERAQGYNVGERQRIGDWNKQNVQAMQMYNREQRNKLLQQGFENQATRADLIRAAAQPYGSALMNEQAANQQNIAGMGRAAGSLIGGLLPFAW